MRTPRLGPNERAYTLKVLRDYGWNVSWAAWALGEDRSNLLRRLRRLGIDSRAMRAAEWAEHSWWGATLRAWFKRPRPDKVEPTAKYKYLTRNALDAEA